MSTKHTPEPWKWADDWKKLEYDSDEGRITEKYLDLRLIGKNGSDVIPLRVDHSQIEIDWSEDCLGGISEADRSRIVTCVNACAGIDYPASAIEGARKVMEEARNVMWILRLHCPPRSSDEKECVRMVKQMEKALASLTPAKEQEAI